MPSGYEKFPDTAGARRRSGVSSCSSRSSGSWPSVRIVREVKAALKSSGEHDRIIADVGAEVQRRPGTRDGNPAAGVAGGRDCIRATR